MGLRLLPWLFAIFILAGGEVLAQAPRPPALPFPSDLPWLNVSRPLTMEELRGKVVILDFWTYGCINCMHVLPDLKRLEEKYGTKLAIIGVHSPKFENEKRLETLRKVLLRYGIEHPVVNDIGFTLWRAYGVRAWPTLIVIDPEGKVVGQVAGEGHYALLDRVVGELLEAFKEKIDPTPLPLALEKEKLKEALLAAPGKVAVSPRWVAVSDTLHHRIILADHQGNILRIFGGSEAGFQDGTFKEARFSSPQGLAFAKEALFVADTGNHAIRRLDLKSGQVETVAGTGKMGFVDGLHPAFDTPLRSPWDVAYRHPYLYIAMAGSHQIWRLDLEKKVIGPYAGSGREDILDGPLKQAAFSQPSGLALKGPWLYVADAEDSAVRRIHLQEGRVETLVGKGLFVFGDRDGPFEEALLQHVLGIAALDENRILIADTYNHKLKQLDLKRRIVTTLAGTGKPDVLNEPGGLAVLGESVLIADTNHHRIVRYHLETGELSPWPLR